MKISTKGRYALRTMLDLAMHDEGTLIPLKDISSRQGITVKYLEQVMNLLSKAGYVRSVRGAGGGYRLARVPSDCLLYTSSERIETGLKKFGAMLGDNGEVGCNAVLNPGTVIGRESNVYPTSMVRGFVPARSIFKNTGEVVQKKII